MKLTKNRITLALATAAICSHTFAAQAANPNTQLFNLTHQSQTITVDGVMNEPQWKNATEIELKYENDPGEGLPAPVKTMAYLYEDGENLHIAFKAYDPDPSKIRAYLRDRDTLYNDDHVGLVIDTFADQRSGFEFYVNPMGAQADRRMTDNGGWQADDSWDAIWDSAAKITDDGYVVEMTIPFSALRFPDSNEELTWNIALNRSYPRSVSHQIYNYKSDRNLDCNICQFDQIKGFKTVKAGSNVQMTPTLTSARSDSKDAGEGWQNGSFDQDIGLNLRWGITQDMVLNATINPDFSQIEADAAQLDINNTFSLFYREKRPFFLDGSDYFDTERLNLVHTRNIADPDYGVKLTGKTDQHSYGALVADDNQTTFLIPGHSGSSIAPLTMSSQAAIGRYKMDVGERSSVGVLVSNRNGDDYSNTVASVDGKYYLTKQDSISYQVAMSDTENPYEVQTDFDLTQDQRGNAYSVGYSHNTRDYSVRASYTDVQQDFRADLGFMSRVDYKRVVVGGDQTWFNEEGQTLTQYGYFGDWDKTFDQDGNVLEEEVELHANLQGQNQFFSNMGVVHRNRLHSGVYYDETQAMAYAQITPMSGLELSSFTRYGKQIDFSNDRLGDVFDLEGSFTWQWGKHFEMDVSHNYSNLEFEGNEVYSANQSDVRLSYQFDIRSYVRLVVQYTDITRDPSMYLFDDVDSRSKNFSTQLLYSYKLNPQTLVYLGYSDSGYQDDDLSRIEKTDRTVFAKFSYAWQM